MLARIMLVASSMMMVPPIESVVADERNQLEVLYAIVEAEATGEGFEGKRLVAEVILNRVAHPSFPDNIIEVVFEPMQFSPVMDGRFYEVPITYETILAVNMTIERGVRHQNKDLLFFQNKRVSGWIDRNREFKKNYKNHNFYN